jgi:hypothetical protein
MYYAVLGTALPTDASTALAAAYKPLGYISAEGIRPALDTSIDKIKAFGGDVVAALLTDESRSFEATLLEVFGSEVNSFIFGSSNVTITAPTVSVGTKTYVQDKGGKPAQCVIVLDLKHGTKRRRLVVPIADPVVSGEEPYTDGGLMAYTLQIEALKNASGVRVYDYLENDDHT